MLTTLLHLPAAVLRRTWLVTTLAIALCSAFAARAVAAFVARDLTGVPPAATAPERGKTPRVPREAPPDGRVLVDRNIFCSACGGPGDVEGPGFGYHGEPAVLIATSLGTLSYAT